MKEENGALSQNSAPDAKMWIRGAMALLAEKGVDGVRVEPLAKRLNITKGSFYWHFKDRNALLERILSEWRRMATISIIARLDSQKGTPAERLQSLLRLPLSGGSSQFGADVELSIRLWGRQDRRARETLEEVDRLRLVYIANLLREIGVKEDLAPARAVIAYSYMRVAATLIAPGEEALRLTCEALLTTA